MILALTFRTILVTINVAAVAVIIGVVAYKVLSVRRAPKEVTPQNLTPFFADETLEDRHLTRVLRWALILSTVVAVVLPLYWVLEPKRQEAEAEGFEERAIERGATLYANDTMPAFDSTKSLQCANCHGADGAGGQAQFVITPEAQGNTEARPIQVAWKAPALDTVLSRFDEEQLTQIITYGRPGTPMPAWGIEGGGPKNTQSISDLVEYLKSIQLSPTKARAQVSKDVAALRAQAKDALSTAETNLAEAQAKRDAATRPVERAAAELEIAAAEKALARSRDFAAQVDNASRGEILFAAQCARCHTQGWSYVEPADPLVPMPSPMGSGAFGPPLVGGSVLEQFPGAPADDPNTPGFQKQIEWVRDGVPANKGYGVRGISSGRMPHFGQILTQEQINAIVTYERNL